MKRFVVAAFVILLCLFGGQGGRPIMVCRLGVCTPTLQMSQGDFTFTPLHTYYMAASGCSDANNGTSTATPWCSPNHAVVCGDVIIAQAGTYGDFQSWGTVTTCPSTTGGIDGAGGIYFAVLLCAGADLTSCAINHTGSGWAMDIQKNNWAVEGWQITGSGGTGAFVANGHTVKVDHIAFINNIASNVGIGFGAQDDGVSHAVPGTVGYDYTALVGDIAQNAEQNTICTAAMVFVAPSSIDSNAGTHFLMYGNFAWNQPNNSCASDEENFMFDTFDAHGVTNQSVFLNNIGWSAWRMGTQIFIQNFNSVTGLHVYIENNTMYNDMLKNTAGVWGDMNFQNDNSAAPFETIYNNISFATSSTVNCGVNVGGANGPSSLANVDTGTVGNENVFFSNHSGSSTCAFNGYTISTHNFLVNPTFTDTTDLLTNRTGAPNCSGFVNVTACMGWNAATATLTVPSVISDLTPTCGSNCTGKGYQNPGNCVTSGPYNDLYPTWLKGIVYLQASGFVNGATIVERAGLVTKPCGL